MGEMPIASKIFRFSLLRKFREAVGFNGCLKQKIPDPVKKILKRDFRTNTNVRGAFLSLNKIGTQDAADGIIKLMDSRIVLGYSYPIANGGLVLLAVSCLKDMDNPARNLGKLLCVEKDWYERRNSSLDASDKSKLADNTHEDVIIPAIEEIGGEEAIKALKSLVLPHYPEKAQAAIIRLNSIIFHPS
jgi:hypothetical protein